MDITKEIKNDGSSGYFGPYRFILEQVKRSSIRILQEGGIPIEIQPSTKDFLELKDGELLVKATYAYAPKNAFSIPLQDDYLAVWLDLSRLFQQQNGQEKLATRRSTVNFSKVFTNAHELDNSELTLGSLASNTMSNLSCDILRFSANMDCEDRKSFINPKFKEIKPCQDALSKKGAIDKMLEDWQ